MRKSCMDVVRCGYESWTIKKAEYQRTDAFRSLCWRRLLRVLGQQGGYTNQSQRESTLTIHWKK